VAVSGASELAVQSWRAQAEHERDRQWLGWIGRFRFVTVAELALRFAVSRQQAQARIRHLGRAELLARAPASSQKRSRQPGDAELR
jgi:hypothetical protein